MFFLGYAIPVALCLTVGEMVLGLTGALLPLPKANAQMVYHRDRGLEVLRNNTCGAAEYLIIYEEGLRQYQQGQFQNALETFQRYRAIAQNKACGDNRQGNQEQEIIALNRLGLVYESLGRYERAKNAFEQAQLLNQSNQDDSAAQFFQGIILNNLGLVFAKLGQYEVARDTFQEALNIHKSLNALADQGASYTGLGLAYFELDQYSESLTSYKQAQAIFRQEDQPIAEGAALNGVGNAYARLNSYQLAMEAFQQALRIHQRSNALALEGRTRSDRGRALMAMGELAEATVELETSITLLESLRQGLDDINQISVFETQTSAYQRLQRVLIALDNPDTALEIAERGRARAIVELLAEKVSEDNAQRIITDAPKIPDIQRIAREQSATLVNYSIVDNAFSAPAIYIWIIQPNGNIIFRSTDLTTQNLALAVEVARVSVGSRNRSAVPSASGRTSTVNPVDDASKNEFNTQLQTLYQLLIDPIADLLPDDPDANVVFIPHGELFLVPFPALMDETGTYLIEKHTILTAPSIQVLDLTRKQAERPRPTVQTNRAIVVGNPTMPELYYPGPDAYLPLLDLPGAEREATQIAQLLGIFPFLGSRATEAKLKQQMSTANTIHLATHGLLEYGDPTTSGVRDMPGAIALAPGEGEDGLLTSLEILDLDLNANLVVLSACDTGLGKITGDGVIGLSRSFVAAGVPSIIVSLWAVPDAPTAELMTTFYQNLQQGQNKAQALRQAMLSTMETHSNPRDWASFTLIGEAE
ncbi:MAG: CHAT domain-containing tetratricopeptide repeat protein [Cyanobacteria bacterium P01_F01_bin.150]